MLEVHGSGFRHFLILDPMNGHDAATSTHYAVNESNNELRHGITNHLRDLPLIPSFLPPIRSSTLEKFEFLPESFLHSISFRIFLLRFSIDSFFSPLVEKDSARKGSYDKKILVSLGGIKKKKGI